MPAHDCARNGSIAFEVSRRASDGVSTIEFSVTDTGAGMTPEQAAKTFEPFTQADVTTTRKYGGTGLGLAIVSRFCHLMGGTVSVESRPNEGSCFPSRDALARITTHLSHKRAVEGRRESEARYALAMRGANDGLGGQTPSTA